MIPLIAVIINMVMALLILGQVVQKPMSDSTYMKLRASLTPKMTKYIPHTPTPKQTAFLLIPHREAFYGGAAGGGKSDALLMAALQYVDVPGYSALLLRRTYSDLSLPGSLMERAEQWLQGTDAKWVDKDKTWTFPSGAKLVFGYLKNENDKYRYKSAEFQFVGFDELTQFTETMYLYLLSRLRRPKGSTIPIRLRGASNPGDIGHEWVRRRFVDYKPHVLPGTRPEEIFRTVRPFVPAKLSDNPHLDDEEYVENLKELDPLTLVQLLNGDWTARRPGATFKREDFCRLVDREELPKGLYWVRFWDIAATEKKGQARDTSANDPDWTAGARVAYHRDTDDWYLWDIRRIQGDPGKVERHIRATAKVDKIDVKQRMEQEPGASGKIVIDTYRRSVFVGFDFKGIRSTGKKESRATIFASAVANHRFVLVRGPYIEALLRECEAWPMKGVGIHDDQIDAISGAMQCQRKRKKMRAIGRRGDVLIREQREQQAEKIKRRAVLA